MRSCTLELEENEREREMESGKRAGMSTLHLEATISNVQIVAQIFVCHMNQTNTSSTLSVCVCVHVQASADLASRW